MPHHRPCFPQFQTLPSKAKTSHLVPYSHFRSSTHRPPKQATYRHKKWWCRSSTHRQTKYTRPHRRQLYAVRLSSPIKSLRHHRPPRRCNHRSKSMLHRHQLRSSLPCVHLPSKCLLPLLPGNLRQSELSSARAMYMYNKKSIKVNVNTAWGGIWLFKKKSVLFCSKIRNFRNVF